LKEPNDWLRREIETAMDTKRNIVPLMLENFDFGSPLVTQALTGNLSTLNEYNGLRVYSDYFFEAMDKLRQRYLNVEVSNIATLNIEAKGITEVQKTAANEAPQVEIEELTAQEWFERGYVFQQDKNFDEAIRCYHKALQLRPDLSAADNNLGVLLSTLGRFTEAEEAFRQAIAKGPNLAQAYNNLTVMLRQIGHEADAIPILEKFMAVAPDNFHSYLGIASIQKRLGKPVSEDYLKKARALIAPEDWYNLACLESICGNLDTAFECLKKAAQKEEFDRPWAWQDPDFTWLRDEPRFAEIVGPPPKRE